MDACSHYLRDIRPCTCHTHHQFYACGCPDLPLPALTYVPCPVASLPPLVQDALHSIGFQHNLQHDPVPKVLPFACYKHTVEHTKGITPQELQARKKNSLAGRKAAHERRMAGWRGEEKDDVMLRGEAIDLRGGTAWNQGVPGYDRDGWHEGTGATEVDWRGVCGEVERTWGREEAQWFWANASGDAWGLSM